jgi:hypothetical protein
VAVKRKALVRQILGLTPHGVSSIIHDRNRQC